MDLNTASAMAQRLRKLGYQSRLVPSVAAGQTLYVVQVGPYPTPQDAAATDAELRREYNAAYGGVASQSINRTASQPTPLAVTHAVSEIVPAGQWAIVLGDGWVMGKPGSGTHVQGFASMEECEAMRRAAAHSAVHGAINDMSEGFGPGTDLGDIDYSSWQDLEHAGCARSDGSVTFTVRQQPGS